MKIDGKTFQTWRIAQGIKTVAELEAVIGISRRTIENWELRGVPSDTFNLIKGCFGLARNLCRLEYDDDSDIEFKDHVKDEVRTYCCFK